MGYSVAYVSAVLCLMLCGGFLAWLILLYGVAGIHAEPSILYIYCHMRYMRVTTISSFWVFLFPFFLICPYAGPALLFLCYDILPFASA